MRKVMVIAVSALALAGCDEPQTDEPETDASEVGLVGSWSCAQVLKDGTALIDVQYGEGGQLSAQIESSMERDAIPIELKGATTGTWELNGDTLTETYVEYKMLDMTVNGEPMTDAAVIQDIEQSLANRVGTSTVATLDEKILYLSNPDGAISCDRVG